jgi:hypothetical protein
MIFVHKQPLILLSNSHKFVIRKQSNQSVTVSMCHSLIWQVHSWPEIRSIHDADSNHLCNTDCCLSSVVLTILSFVSKCALFLKWIWVTICRSRLGISNGISQMLQLTLSISISFLFFLLILAHNLGRAVHTALSPF